MKPAWIYVLGLAVGAALGADFASVHAQKAERGTQQWLMLNLPTVGFSDRVDVVDTTGVCLYVVRGGSNNYVSVTAVPKSQLPQGSGCQ